MASSLSLSSHTVASLFPSHTSKPQLSLSKSIPILTKSSQSQFHGLKFSHSSSLSIPRFSTFKTSISAKVNKGAVPPAFTLKDQDGKTVSLSKFKGKPVVVYFYPADETPGCTKQACAFRDSYEKFKKAGAEVIGISVDSAESHKATIYVAKRRGQQGEERVGSSIGSIRNIAWKTNICSRQKRGCSTHLQQPVSAGETYRRNLENTSKFVKDICALGVRQVVFFFLV
ncbi:hypothetical protein ES319_D08G294800v1 [Gossypium barbadense]|uniref:Peroxiredoxin Q, chloroplastic n=1 Tax=Gossypium barbadense TaxID=3634 RepID=A0A5J5QK62_GOSBA|nr:hypothetical protein ES319_D08G294800v1 [Gossypium barbadense]